MTTLRALFIAFTLTASAGMVAAEPTTTPVPVVPAGEAVGSIVTELMSGCQEQRWLRTIQHQGRDLQLDDGSLWQVDSVQALDTVSWTPTDPIVVCHADLTDTTEHQLVHARLLHPGHPDL